MPAGDSAMGMTYLGKQFMSQAKDLYQKFSENDKHVMSSILKDVTLVQALLLTHGEDHYYREMNHIKAQFANLGAEYANEAQERAFKMVGDIIGAVASGFLKRVL